MQIVTFLYKNSPRVGIVDGDNVVLSPWSGTVLGLLNSGITPQRTSERIPLAETRLLAPLQSGKILCVGRNYAAHAAELNNEVSEAPLLFSKFTTSVIGHGDAVTWDESITTQVDWEVELAVVIGRRAQRVTTETAGNHIFGYTIAVDITARDLQDSESQWTRAKGMDTFCPVGPYLVTKSEIADPQALRLTLSLNGETMQDGNTADMIHDVNALVAYCSQTFTLEPGDMILTGTPLGVGKAQNPPRFLKDGDEITATIEGIGTLVNRCQVLRA